MSGFSLLAIKLGEKPQEVSKYLGNREHFGHLQSTIFKLVPAHFYVRASTMGQSVLDYHYCIHMEGYCFSIIF